MLASLFLVSGALSSVIFLPGCSSQFPRTHPTKGKVVFKGGKVVTAGNVELVSTSDTNMRAFGEIAEDGTFTLIAVNKDNREREGAVEGEYKVFVEIAPGEQEDSRRKRIALPGTKIIKAGANELLIEIDPPRAK